jgi:hypothetical protein
MEKYISNEGLAIVILGVLACWSASTGDLATAGTIAAGLIGFIGGKAAK